MYADMLDTIGFVAKYDPELGSAMQEELARQRRNIEPVSYTHLHSFPAAVSHLLYQVGRKKQAYRTKICYDEKSLETGRKFL